MASAAPVIPVARAAPMGPGAPPAPVVSARVVRAPVVLMVAVANAAATTARTAGTSAAISRLISMPVTLHRGGCGRQRNSAAGLTSGRLGAHARPVAEWIYFLHPPRENFAETMTEAEQAVWADHFARLKRLHAEGTLILAGPTLGSINTGIVIIEAADEDAARKLMSEDPAIASGYARGELRPFRISLLLGRD